jgi:hypothetical protein
MRVQQNRQPSILKMELNLLLCAFTAVILIDYDAMRRMTEEFTHERYERERTEQTFRLKFPTIFI